MNRRRHQHSGQESRVALRAASSTTSITWRNNFMANPIPARRLFLASALVCVLALLLALAWTGGSPIAAQDTGEGPPARPAGLQVSAEQGSLDVSVDWNDVD